MKRILTLVMCALIALPSISQKFNEHPWKKKRVAYFGDSITDPRLKASKTKYWGFLEEWLGITPYVYGVSGRQWNDIPRQADKLKAEHGDDFDAILIFIGTNDFNAAVPIGEWYNVSADSVVAAHKGQWEKAKYLRYHRTMNMNNSTLKGRINIALDKLKKMYPKKQIVLMTPIHRADFKSSDTNIQPAEDYANACGFFIDDYVQAIKEAGDKITEDDKSKVQAEVDALKAVLEKYKETEKLTDEQVQEIKDAQEKLMNASQPVFTKMYEQAAQEAQAAQQAEGAADAGASQDDNVEDADYEEV